MTKQLNKAIMDSLRIKGRNSKWHSRENILDIKKAKRLCKNEKAKKQYFKSVFSKNMAATKQCWDVVKAFFSNKNLHSDDHISINDNSKIVDNEVKLVELFNNCFTNAVENTTGKAPTSLDDSSNQQNGSGNVEKIILEYKNKAVKINESFKNFKNFDLPKANR